MPRTVCQASGRYYPMQETVFCQHKGMANVNGTNIFHYGELNSAYKRTTNKKFQAVFLKSVSYKSKVLSRGVFRYHISPLRRSSIVKQDTSLTRDIAINLKPADGSQYLSSVARISPYFPRTHRHIRWRRRMEELALEGMVRSLEYGDTSRFRTRLSTRFQIMERELPPSPNPKN